MVCLKRRAGKTPLLAQEDFLRSVYQAAHSGGGGFVEHIESLLKIACEHFEMPLGMLIRVDAGLYNILGSYDVEGKDRLPVDQQMVLAGTPCADVFRLGEKVIEDNLADCRAKYPNTCLTFKRYIGVPVVMQGQIIGTLCFVDPESGDRPLSIKDEQIGILALVAGGLIERELHLESEHKHQQIVSIVESCEDAFFTLSPGGGVQSWNNSAHALFGYAQEEAIGRSVHDLFAENDHELIDLLLERVMGGSGTESFDAVNTRRDESEFSSSITLSPIRDQNGVIQSVAAMVKGTDEKKRAERALAESEQRYALAAKGSNDGLWDWDLSTDEVYYSPRLLEILGFGEDKPEPALDTWRHRIHQDDLAQFDADMATHLADKNDSFYNEHRITTLWGKERWVLSRGVAVRDKFGQAVRIAGSLTDITKQKQSEAALLQQAQQDKLTGLPNRALLTEMIRSSMSRASRRPGYKFAVLFLDFDRFKVINDSLGHEFGDMLLISIAQQLRVQIRTVDAAARLGGDEFVVLLDDIDGLGTAIEVAERLLHCFSKPHSIGGHDVTSTASIGIVMNDESYTRPELMIRDADTAMYQAKAAGKARYVVFDEQMHARALERLNLEKELRKAIALGQIWLAYQPIVSLDNGRLLGFETLVRWDHPELGSVPPDQFIEIAEETGEIVEIGNWVLRKACRQLVAWQEQFPRIQTNKLHMNINVSKRQLSQPDTVKNLETIFNDTGVSPQDIKLEITESVIMDDPERITVVLDKIRELGVQLAMDDFGTGHSSLSCLHRFSLDVLKIDREFIRNMEQRVEYTAVIQAIVTLAHTMGISVVAEGLETAEQVAQLQALECDCAQGYFFAKPLTPQEAGHYITGFHDQRRSA